LRLNPDSALEPSKCADVLPELASV
jgi:hypothetical protein